MKLARRRNGGVCVYIQSMPAKQTSAWHIDITFPDFADCFFSRKLPRWMASNGEKHHYSENIYWLVVSNIFYFSIIYGRIIPTDFHIFQRGRLNHQAVILTGFFRCVFPEEKPGFSHAQQLEKTNRYVGLPNGI